MEAQPGRDEEKRIQQIQALLESLDHQSKHGGSSSPEARGGAGPYWPEKFWRGFCSRVKQGLMDCGYSATEADAAIAKATENVEFYS